MGWFYACQGKTDRTMLGPQQNTHTYVLLTGEEAKAYVLERRSEAMGKMQSVVMGICGGKGDPCGAQEAEKKEAAEGEEEMIRLMTKYEGYEEIRELFRLVREAKEKFWHYCKVKDPGVHSGLWEGDLILDKVHARKIIAWYEFLASQHSRRKRALYLHKDEHRYKPWPKSEDSATVEVKYRFVHPDGKDDDNTRWEKKQLRVFKQAQKAIEAKTCIRLVEDKCAEKDVIMVELVKKVRCAATVGKREKVNHVFFHKRCFLKVGTIIHELLHNLGVKHEHQRLDALGMHITLNETNIRTHALRNFFLDAHIDPIDTYATDYDYKSVMHYSAKAFAKDKK